MEAWGKSNIPSPASLFSLCLCTSILLLLQLESFADISIQMLEPFVMDQKPAALQDSCRLLCFVWDCRGLQPPRLNGYWFSAFPVLQQSLWDNYIIQNILFCNIFSRLLLFLWRPLTNTLPSRNYYPVKGSFMQMRTAMGLLNSCPPTQKDNRGQVLPILVIKEKWRKLEHMLKRLSCSHIIKVYCYLSPKSLIFRGFIYHIMAWILQRTLWSHYWCENSFKYFYEILCL